MRRLGDRCDAFRRDELMTFTATLQGDRVPGISLTVDAASKKAGTPQRPSQAG
jgi:hypothetical protein